MFRSTPSLGPSIARALALTLACAPAVLGLVACAVPPDATPPGGAAPAADVASADADAAAAVAKGDASKGEADFKVCAGCHGPNGEGVQGLGKELRANAFLAAMTDDEAVAFLKKGRPASDPLNTTGVDMPPKGGNPALSDEDLYDVVAFMRALK